MAKTRSELQGDRTRRAAALACASVLDSRFFKALCEPVRVEIIRLLMDRGRSDLGSLAAELPQDASVISRHLGVLHAAGIVHRQKEGRHAFFAVDGAGVLRRFEEIVTRLKRAAPLCCPGPERARR